MNMSDSLPHFKGQLPIGIFDSGLGGFTVTHAITKLIPTQNLVYYGDTLHTPWGDKSVEAIERYAVNISRLLLRYECPIIVVACNTASATVTSAIEAILPKNCVLLNVIDPVIDYLAANHSQDNIGLIGTKQTILSNAYPNKLKSKAPQATMHAMATPLLVPFIEEGFHHNQALTETVLSTYLNREQLKNIDALVLGCTHYPLVKQTIQNFYANHFHKKVDVIDSASLVARALKKIIATHPLFNQMNQNTQTGEKLFMISDPNPHFQRIAESFFEDSISLTHYLA